MGNNMMGCSAEHVMGCGGERCDGARSGDSVMGRDGCEEAVVSWHLITCGHQSKRVCVHRSPELPFGPDDRSVEETLRTPHEAKPKPGALHLLHELSTNTVPEFPCLQKKLKPVFTSEPCSDG